MSNPSLLFLPGDGIGPEVMTEVRKVIEWFERHRGFRFDISEDHVGGAAIDAYGTYLRDETLEKALNVDAVLFGSIGTPILEVVANIPHPDLKTKNTNWEENLSPEMTEKLWPKDGEPELHVVYGQRIFKGNWEFEKFTIDHKFDAAKLTVLTETWAEEKVITGFMYEDKHIKFEGCTDVDHKWDRAWIDDYLLD